MLQGKRALVTGASRGIGRAIALAMAERGAEVAVNYARSEARAEEVAELCGQKGGRSFAVQADVSQWDQVQEMREEIYSRFDGLDILVNNAGITRDGLLMRMKQEDWEEVMRTNLTGVFNCSRTVVRGMIKQRSGRIISIASVVGQMGNAGQANYAASKAGVLGFTRSLARELAGRGICVNAVAPGFITTDMTRELSEKQLQELTGRIPMDRLGKPEDVAPAVCFLASEEAGYITGQVLNINGGMVM